MQNKPTTDEHYIPQCYLKQFSLDGERIYQYDVITGKPSPVPVPIKSICYEKHLYEFRNDTGDFLHRNLIEKAFGKYEGEFAAMFRSIQSKSSYEANFKFKPVKDKGYKETDQYDVPEPKLCPVCDSKPLITFAPDSSCFTVRCRNSKCPSVYACTNASAKVAVDGWNEWCEYKKK